MRDMFSSYKVVHLLDAQSISATTNSLACDLAGFNRVLLLVNIGALSFGSSSSLTVKLQESDDETTWADVPADWQKGNFATISDTNSGQTTLACTYLGYKRYVRVVLDVTESVSGPVSVDAVLTDARHNPVNP